MRALRNLLLVSAFLVWPFITRAQFTFITNADNTLAITAYTGTNLNVTIPAITNGMAVTIIGTNAFSDAGLTNVVIPEGITDIEDGAFYWNLFDSVTLPNSLLTIGSHAFLNCYQMTNVVFGNSITNIGSMDDGQGVFYLTELNSLVIPNSVRTIGSRAFLMGNLCLTNVVIGTNVTTIGDFAFNGDSQFHSLTIPDSVNYIGAEAFAFCEALTNITVGKGVTTIGSYAFYYCSALTSLTILRSATNFGDEVFAYCPNLTSLTLGHGVTTVWDNAFQNCTLLANLTLPDTLTSIGTNAFANTALASLVFPPSLTSIGYGAFANCYHLKEITIPAGVTSIGDQAFYGIPLVNGAYFEGNAPIPGPTTFGFASDPFGYPIIYYLPGTTGWGPTFSGRPAVEWNPQAVTTDGFFGVRTNVFGFNMTGNSNVMVVVQVATNLGNPVWQSLGTNMFSNRPIYFSDPQWTNSPNRFYRFRSP